MGKVKKRIGKLVTKRAGKAGPKLKFQEYDKGPTTLPKDVDIDIKLSGKGCATYMSGNRLVAIELEDGTPLYGKIPEGEIELVTKVIPKKTEKPTQSDKARIKQPCNSTDTAIADSFDIDATFLPESTKKALRGWKDEDGKGIDNFSLKFNVAARWDSSDEDNPKFKHFSFNKNDPDYQYCLHANFGEVKFKEIAARVGRQARAIGATDPDYAVISLQAKPAWRWAIGLGNASVYENGMTLHHVFGIPYLPGSGLKGMLRNWVLRECFGHEKGYTSDDEDAGKNAETAALQNPIFVHLFGHGKLGKKLGQVGKATFFDAFPTRPPTVAVDIVNNHFGDYYAAKTVNGTDAETPPADWLQPVPVFFMNVKGGTLQFHIGIQDGQTKISEAGKASNGEAENKPDSGQLHSAVAKLPPWQTLCPDRLKGEISGDTTYTEFVRIWLQDALTHGGIGAKTAVGYGRMTIGH